MIQNGINQEIPWKRDFLEKLTFAQPVKMFTAILWDEKFYFKLTLNNLIKDYEMWRHMKCM